MLYLVLRSCYIELLHVVVPGARIPHQYLDQMSWPHNCYDTFCHAGQVSSNLISGHPQHGTKYRPVGQTPFGPNVGLTECHGDQMLRWPEVIKTNAVVIRVVRSSSGSRNGIEFLAPVRLQLCLPIHWIGLFWQQDGANTFTHKYANVKTHTQT